MLDFFAVGHFKSFGPAQLVRFKPITLLFGANSAGKSSLLQALLLMKHALETGDFDADEVTSGGEHVNLGGISRMLHRHDDSRSISLFVGTRATATPSDAYPHGTPALGLQLDVGLEESRTDPVDPHEHPVIREGLKAANIYVDGLLLGSVRATGHVRESDARRYGLGRVVRAQSLNWAHPLLNERLQARAADVVRTMNLTDRGENIQERVADALARAVRSDLRVEQSDLLRGRSGQSHLRFTSNLEGVFVERMPSADLRYLHVLAPFLADPLTRHFQAVVRHFGDLGDQGEWTRTLGPGFFDSVFSENHRPSGQSGFLQEALEAREAYRADAALAARWAQARDASRMIAYLWEDVMHLFLGTFSAVGQSFEQLTFLGPLRTVPERHFGGKQADDGRWQANGASAWTLLRGEADVRERVNTWMSAKLGMTYQVRVRRLYDEAQLRYRTQRAHHFALQDAASWLMAYLPEAMLAADVTPAQISRIWDHLRHDLDTEGGRRPPLENGKYHAIGQTVVGEMPEGLLRDPSWLSIASARPGSPLFSLAASVKSRSYWQEHYGPEQPLPAAAELTLFDSRNRVDVGARDVGLGVSQVLPVLVNAAAGAGRTVLIEQPELHLHPALQAELADVLVESVRERGHTFVLETHSEHLILRLLRRIRETSDPEAEGNPALQLTVQDLAVLYANPAEEGTRIEEVEITPDGDFLHHWPTGFFADRSRELF